MFKTKILPSQPEELTAVWLTDILQDRGVIENTAVTTISYEILGGAGYVGQMARVYLTYDDPNPDWPTSLIAKFSSPDPELREGFYDLYAREVMVYQELADEISLTLPVCYFSELEEDTGCSLLILEDLSHLRVDPVTDGCTFNDAELVVSQFAQHHAQWWDSSRLDEIALIQVDDNYDPEWLETYKAWWLAFEGKICEVVPDSFMPAAFLDMGERYSSQVQAVYDKTKSTPDTLLHKDTHMDNFMFADGINDSSLTVLDWQLCGRGSGVRDMTYFMIFSMSVQLRRQSERRLIKTYHDTLIGFGVQNYSFEQCWHDYRLAFFGAFTTIVIATNIVDFSGDHGRQLINVLIPRLVSFAEDHQVSEFLT